MKKISVWGIILLIFCFLGNKIYAQEFEVDTVYKKQVGKEKTVASVYFINRGKIIETTTPLKIGEFDTITISVSWKKRFVEKIFFDNVKYIPTEKEIKKGRYNFKIAPSKTTTYKYVHYFKNGEKFEVMRKLTILDKNGKVIE